MPKGLNEDKALIYKYRGMPIKDENGNAVFASARDVGNYGAGYIAARNGIDWQSARMAFDALETIQKDRFSFEGNPTVRAQFKGHRRGEIDRIMKKMEKMRDMHIILKL